MPITASAKSGADFEPVAAGTHHAICYGVIDLGTQPSGNPQFADARKVCILFELPQERGDFKNKDGSMSNKPRAISGVYTLSLGVKANLRKMLESWRSRAFTSEELEGFDVSKLIGANCMLSVIHKPGTGKNAGKVYANVSSVSSLPKGMGKAAPENPTLYFSLSDFAEGQPIEFPENMPDWIKAKIGQSREFLEHPTHPEPAPTNEQDNGDSDVPF